MFLLVVATAAGLHTPVDCCCSLELAILLLVWPSAFSCSCWSTCSLSWCDHVNYQHKSLRFDCDAVFTGGAMCTLCIDRSPQLCLKSLASMRCALVLVILVVQVEAPRFGFTCNCVFETAGLMVLSEPSESMEQSYTPSFSTTLTLSKAIRLRTHSCAFASKTTPN